MTLPLAVTYDTANRRVQFVGAQAGELYRIAVNELYSDFKDAWPSDDSLASVAGYYPVWGIRTDTGSGSVGGNPLSATSELDGYFFLNNADGWTIEMPSVACEFVFEGNLYRTDANSTIFTYGATTPAVEIEFSSRATVINVDSEEILAILLANIDITTTPGKQLYLDSVDGSTVVAEFDLENTAGGTFNPTAAQAIGKRTRVIT